MWECSWQENRGGEAVQNYGWGNAQVLDMRYFQLGRVGALILVLTDF